MRAGRYEEARALFERQRRQADALGVTGAPRWLMDTTRAFNELGAGRYEEAEAILDPIVVELESAGWERRALGAWAALALCQRARGAEEDADRSLARVEELVARRSLGDRANQTILELVSERFARVDPARAARLQRWLREMA